MFDAQTNFCAEVSRSCFDDRSLRVRCLTSLSTSLCKRAFLTSDLIFSRLFQTLRLSSALSLHRQIHPFNFSPQFSISNLHPQLLTTARYLQVSSPRRSSQSSTSQFTTRPGVRRLWPTVASATQKPPPNWCMGNISASH